MSTPLVSIIIPSNRELFLAETIRELLEKCTGPIEIIAVLDGYWPDDLDVVKPLPDDPRVHILHKGKTEGMRPAINDAAAMARGEFLMKIDAHCMISRGLDQALAAHCDADWIVVPRRYSLDAINWTILNTGKAPVDAHYLSYPFVADWQTNGKRGLHGSVWNRRASERKHILFDDEMSSQGSCWFMRREYFWRQIGPLDVLGYGNFVSEMQEVGLRCWLSGGRMKVLKGTSPAPEDETWYAHLHKGREFGRMYWISKAEMERGTEFSKRFWMLDKWAQRTHDLRYLIELFQPPEWPNHDLDAAFRLAHQVLK